MVLIGTMNRLLAHLDHTVKKDVHLKIMTLLTYSSAYTKHNQINLFVRGPSSIGKTYNLTQATKYLPRADLWLLGGLSATALVHEHGNLIDEDGEIIPDVTQDMKPDEVKALLERMKGARYIVDLERKILVFLEAPSHETYARLRPILSHDVPEVEYKFTDRESRKKLRTMTVVIRGWPATVFATTDIDYLEDLMTRGFTVTPEMTSEKYKAAVQVMSERDCMPEKSFDPELSEIKKIMLEIKEVCGIYDALVPYSKVVSDVYPHDQGRDMRDYARFTCLVKQSALIHADERLKVHLQDGRKYVLCSKDDLQMVLGAFSVIEETTRTGLPAQILDFYRRVMIPLHNKSVNPGFSFDVLADEYKSVYGRVISKDTLRLNYVRHLIRLGLADSEPDPADKRRNLISVVMMGTTDTSKRIQNSFDTDYNKERFMNWEMELATEHGKADFIFNGKPVTSEDEKFKLISR